MKMHLINGIVSVTIVWLICLTQSVMSSWEYAVTTKGEIKFFDSNWNITTSAAHQFTKLSAITFDETEETIYFNDQAQNTSTMFTLQLSKDTDYNHRIESVLAKTKDELVQGIAFDPLDRMLYWTDSKNKYIYSLAVDRNEEPKILIKLDEGKIPQGIAIDICRRKIYWTNANHANPSIERASIDGSKQEILINSELFMPSGIAVDQFSKRIYWVDDVQGQKYSIESAALDGTDRTSLVTDFYNAPFNLAVDHYNVYWTDFLHNAVWKVAKNRTDSLQPEIVQNFTNTPKGIVARVDLLSAQANNPDCRAVVYKIKSTLVTSTPSVPSSTPKYQNNPVICLNNGELNNKTGTCICTNEFKGPHCENAICHNYCLEGTCRVSSTGYAQCNCFRGFSGDRCERDLCTGFCLNGGRCTIENEEPVCQCPSTYHGRHCETMNTKELCRNFCENGVDDSDGLDLMNICRNCSNSYLHDNVHQSSPFGAVCSGGQLNKTAAFVTGGVVISLALAFLIIKTMRRHYSPLRPKIKKTYVVRKNVSKTPLTCRPTTEQCEITIEDCCNMNICDTPCFDPKTLQQEITRKEDKKTLINNMEGDLY